METATVRVDVEYQERYWYPDDGGEVWLAGYYPVDPESGRYLARDAQELAASGLRVVGVAGAGVTTPTRSLPTPRSPGGGSSCAAISPTPTT